MPNSATDRRARFAHEPRTEQEVVCLFTALLDEVGSELQFPCVIEAVRTPFPDCVIRHIETDERRFVEFELEASDFLRHRNRPERCDVLVCWKDNWGDWANMPDYFRVVELAEIAKRFSSRSDGPSANIIAWSRRAN